MSVRQSVNKSIRQSVSKSAIQTVCESLECCYRRERDDLRCHLARSHMAVGRFVPVNTWITLDQSLFCMCEYGD